MRLIIKFRGWILAVLVISLVVGAYKLYRTLEIQAQYEQAEAVFLQKYFPDAELTNKDFRFSTYFNKKSKYFGVKSNAADSITRIMGRDRLFCNAKNEHPNYLEVCQSASVEPIKSVWKAPDQGIHGYLFGSKHLGNRQQNKAQRQAFVKANTALKSDLIALTAMKNSFAPWITHDDGSTSLSHAVWAYESAGFYFFDLAEIH